MTIEDALFSRLSNHTGLAALVGSRIFPNVIPQGEDLPAVTYRKLKAERVHAMGADPGVARARFKVSSWGESYSDAKDASVEVRAALQRWRGTEAGVVVQDGLLENESDEFDTDAARHEVAVEVEIIHQE